MSLKNIEEWEADNLEMKTSWTDPITALNGWLEVFKKVNSKFRENVEEADETKEVGKSCTASLNQSISWNALT